MGADLTTVATMLKEDYDHPIKDLQNHGTFLLDTIRKEADVFENWQAGKRANIPLQTGQNEGLGARGEDEDLPEAGAQGYSMAFFYPKRLYGRIRLTGPAMAQTDSTRKSFVKLLAKEVSGAALNLLQDHNRQLWHDGSSVLAVTTDGGAGSTLVTVVGSTKFIRNGMRVDILRPDATTFVLVASNQLVSAVTATTFTITASIDTAAGDLVILTATRYTASLTVANGLATAPKEVWGIEAAISDFDPGRDRATTANVGPSGLDNAATVVVQNGEGFFGQIRRGDGAGGDAVTTLWDANVDHNSGTLRPLTEDLMQSVEDRIHISSGQDRKYILITNHAIRRQYQKLLTSDRRFTTPMSFQGGYSKTKYKGLAYNDTVLLVDKDASLTRDPSRLNRIYFLNLDSFLHLILKPWQWMDEDGAMLCRVPNRDAYEATRFSYQQLGCDAPNWNGILDDLLES